MTYTLTYRCDCENGDVHTDPFGRIGICPACECVFLAARTDEGRRVVHVYAVEAWITMYRGTVNSLCGVA